MQLTRGLVEQDNVFAVVGSLGTEVNTAIRPYLNSKKVPQMLVSTGATTWGADWKQYPWTTGWQPTYQFEGKLYGQSIARNSPNAKIGVLYQNDDYGKDYIKGLEAGLGAKASNIVDKEPFEVTAPDVKSQIAKLKASGATVFVILATPTKTIQSYATALAFKWLPDVIYTNAVSATDTFLTLAGKANGGNNDARQQDVHDAVREGSGEPEVGQRRRDEALQAGDGEVLPEAVASRTRSTLYGVATAEAFTELLYTAGKNPTRASLLKAFRSWNQANPFLLPGIKQKTDATNQFPIKCKRLDRSSRTGRSRRFPRSSANVRHVSAIS